MQIVINISEEVYEIAKQDKWKWPADDVYNAIKNGTPLPKGHGRLIDADELLKQSYCIDDSATLSTRDVVNVEEIVNALTIIGAGRW